MSFEEVFIMLDPPIHTVSEEEFRTAITRLVWERMLWRAAETRNREQQEEEEEPPHLIPRLGSQTPQTSMCITQ